MRWRTSCDSGLEASHESAVPEYWMDVKACGSPELLVRVTCPYRRRLQHYYFPCNQIGSDMCYRRVRSLPIKTGGIAEAIQMTPGAGKKGGLDDPGEAQYRRRKATRRGIGQLELFQRTSTRGNGVNLNLSKQPDHINLVAEPLPATHA